MERFDCVVIGGGIVGLSVAWEILEKTPDIRIAVLEKEPGWARHQTGRNSGVIHSGIYYKPGSLKAKLCREGNRRLVEFCESYGIRYEVCGKVIVATSDSELPLLKRLYQRGITNGLLIKELTAEQVREIEPHVCCLGGIHVPSTGIVNFVDVCQKLAELIASRGGELRPGTEVKAFHPSGNEGVLETSKNALITRWVINCAGLYSDRIAKLSGANPDVRIVPFRGEYYELKPERRGLVRNLIYPVPDPKFPFLGVHFTRMIDGSVHAGPNAVLSLKREGYHRTSFDWKDFRDTMTYSGFWRMAAKHAKAGLEEMHRSFSKKAFVRSLQKLVPEISEKDLVPGGAGVRAQALRSDGGLVDDFLIVNSSCATHVCNAPSPAATASFEIGRAIVERVNEVIGRRSMRSP
ncbi:MAG TPA: L-2-hydroxyglutarate oxidase [Chthoniobacterales bacterium]|nr:L-2-hydroxyglutarate oxidase [Chthoniobacterales bacterium]